MIVLQALVLLAGGMVQAPSRPVAVLVGVRERLARDTIHLELVFAGSRPGEARIGIAGDPSRTGDFLLEFAGARFDRGASGRLPSWLRDESGKNGDRIRLRGDLDARTPWRGRWDGNTLRLVLLDRVDRGSILTNPWVLGTVGVLAVTGSVIAWTAMDAPESPVPGGPPAAEEDIPPPDIAFP